MLAFLRVAFAHSICHMVRTTSNTLSFAGIAAATATLAAAAQAHNHRRALVLAGAEPWCRQAAAAALADAASAPVLWISEHAPEGANAVKGAQAGSVLGREFDAVVFDAYSGFDVDAFGAAAGTVRGGGLLLLLTPPLDEWPAFPDPEHGRIAVAPFKAPDVTGRFLRRLARVMRTAAGVQVIEQGRETGYLVSDAISRTQDRGGNAPYFVEQEPECRTADQRAAVEAIIRVATGHRRRPVVLTSDRGRGKSAALGIAAAHLLRQGIRRIVVTAPRLDAAAPVFEHARRVLPEATLARGALRLGEACLEFAPPDELVLAPRHADLMLVDEAAAIPAPLLERLLRHYARIAFATTVHGYEGTGRGFAVRFNKVLDRRTPGWKALRLETPIRWAPGDPLERFVFRALLLDAAPAPDEVIAGARVDECGIERLDRDCLADDEAVLAELFGLLVLAHYRTTPGDLRNLLDGPNLSVYAMRYAGHVVATALVAEEGGFDAQTATDIYAGRRRPRGHLIPQSLAVHAGVEQAARLKCARIMRIAVHPAAQGRGLGTDLLQAIMKQAYEAGCDYIGASFGATVELLRFWERSGFLPVRMGLTREASSGTHSAIVLYPLTPAGAEVFASARGRLLDHLPHLLAEPLQDLDPHLVAALLRRGGAPAPALAEQDWRDVAAFAFALRSYETSLAPIWKLVCGALADPYSAELLSEAERAILIAKVLQKRSWAETAAGLEFAGRAAATDALRRALHPLLMHYGDTTARQEARRLARG